jgi:hypothetical protein
MKQMKLTALLILTLANRICYSQTARLIDSQVLPSGKFISLVQTTPESGGLYQLIIIDRIKRDTTKNTIDSIKHAHCSTPNSIFFINDSVGFFTESGGCYASYNWLYRTQDRGLTWKHVESGSRTDGNSFNMLNNQSFYMFNELSGIIVWEINEGKLVFSITTDGGVNWIMKSQVIDKRKGMLEIQTINFSAEGQVTVVFSEKHAFESDRKNVTIMQSHDYGHSFKRLK